MSECGCEHNAQQSQARQNRALIVIPLINTVMFFVEAGAGVLANSSATRWCTPSACTSSYGARAGNRRPRLSRA